MSLRVALAAITIPVAFDATESSAYAQTPDGSASQRVSDTVLVLVPTMPAEGVTLTPLSRNLELYSKDFHPQIQASPMSGSPPQLRAQAIEWGHARHARWVVYLTWDSPKPHETILSLWVVDASNPERRDEVSSMPVPQNPDPPFYREVGLKLRTLLRTVVVVDEQHKDEAPKAPPSPPPRPPTEQPSQSVPAATTSHVGIELSTSGEVPPNFGYMSPGLGLSLRWLPASREPSPPWSFGLSGSYDLPHGAQSATGKGDVAMLRLALSAYRRAGTFGPVELWAAVEAGMASVQMQATLYSSGETRERTDILPFATTALLAGIRFGASFLLLLGPDATFFTARIRGLVTSSEVLATDYTVFGLALRLDTTL